MGVLFEEWMPNRLSIRFASGTPSTTGGIIYLGFDHDPTDPVASDEYTNIAEMADHLVGAADDDQVMSVTFPSKSNMLFTDGTEEIRLTACGSVHAKPSIAGVIGELLLDYDVTFYKPQVDASTAPVPVGDLTFTSDVSATMDTDTAISVGEDPAVISPRLSAAISVGAKYYGIVKNAVDLFQFGSSQLVPDGTPVFFESAKMVDDTFSGGLGFTSATTDALSKMFNAAGEPLRFLAGGTASLTNVLRLST
jgi:hypothetical protein